MQRYVIKSHWHPNSNGTEYTEALGLFATEEEARKEAQAFADDRFEWPSEEEQEDSGVEDEGPDVTVEEYIPGEDGHDCEKEGGGSFEDEFCLMEEAECARADAAFKEAKAHWKAIFGALKPRNETEEEGDAFFEALEQRLWLG